MLFESLRASPCGPGVGCEPEAMAEPTYPSRVQGCLYGLALGDALGAKTEFLKYADIVAKFGPMGPAEPPVPLALVTDDTQMALAVGEALMAMQRSAGPVEWAEALSVEFLKWHSSPDNNRSPGITTMNSLRALADGKPWREATNYTSKGCGANMRVQPVGLLADKHGFTVKKRSRLAQLQAAITHAHPTAVAAADATAHAIHLLTAGLEPAALPQRLKDYAASQRGVYHEEALGDLWQGAGDSSGNVYITRGWNEVLHALEKVEKALERPRRDVDPGLATGHGWVAEEALATALHCFLLFPDDAVATLRRAATTGGDSDSIACIAGALAGACHGVDCWPGEWRDRVEYKERISALAGWYG